MLRQALPPLVSAYAIFVAMVLLARRRPVPRPHGAGDPSARVSVRRVIVTTLGGYAAFLVIVLVFHVWLAAEADAFASAVWGGAFLSGITVAAATGWSLIERRSQR